MTTMMVVVVVVVDDDAPLRMGAGHEMRLLIREPTAVRIFHPSLKYFRRQRRV